MLVGGIVVIVVGVLFIGFGISMIANPDGWEARIQGFPIPPKVGGVISIIIGIAAGVVGGLMAGGVI